MAKDKLDELIEETEEKLEKGESLGDIEAEHHHKVKEESKKEKLEEKIKESKFEKKEEKSKEKTEDATEEEISREAKSEEKPPLGKQAKKQKQGKAKIRSKKYQDAKTLVEAGKKYELNEAIELVKKTSFSKFDGNVEVHIRVLGKSGKPEQLRGLLQYPHATGKKVNVIILDDKTIEEISSTGKAPADIYLTTPQNMPKVAKLAKILGPKGKMPNPKNGTITSDPEKTMKDMSQGQVEYKTDNTGNIHQVIGKVSAKEDILEENFRALIAVLPAEKIASVNLCATMGPAVKVNIK